MITLIPYLNSLAGQCLTNENWQELGVNAAFVSLRVLLIKPGLDYLNSLPSLGQYLGWQGNIVLDASDLSFSLAGLCVIQSPYDGQRIHLEVEQFWTLMKHLNPAQVLLPKSLMDSSTSAQYWKSEATDPYLALMKRFGIQDQNGVFILDHDDRYFFASDQPAVDGLEGRFYQQSERVSILEQQYQLDFQPLDIVCACPTCQQQLTRAYLQHLFQSTPLLCQRYLVMHNWFMSVKHAEWLGG